MEGKKLLTKFDNLFRGGLSRDASGGGSVNDKKHFSGQDAAKGLTVGKDFFGSAGNVKAQGIVGVG